MWSGNQLLTMKPGVLSRTVNSHGVNLLRIVSAKQSATGIKEAKRPFDRVIQDKAYTLDGKQAKRLRKGLYIENKKKIIKR